MTVLPVFLFDIDGVLVVPGGYRKSYLDTVRSFFKQFGIGSIELDHRIPELFEYHEIIAEWDMVPLTIAALLNWAAEAEPARLPLVSLGMIHDLGKIQASIPFTEYLTKKIPELRLAADGRLDSPTRAVFDHCQRLKADSVFPMIWDDPVLATLLCDALNPQTSLTFQRLETFILGSRRFHDCFGFTPVADVVSNLETIDLPILSDDYQKRIAQAAGKTIFASGMTARPNLVPVDYGVSCGQLPCLLPEAEIAMRMFAWEPAKIPVIGAGTINFFEQKHGKSLTHWLKPHPIHALVAVFAALMIPVRNAFELAVAVGGDQPGCVDVRQVFRGKTEVKLFVFEDSPSGIESAGEAAKLLQKAGCTLDFHAYGIYTTPEREAQLRKLNAAIYENINDALDHVFSEVLKAE